MELIARRRREPCSDHKDTGNALGRDNSHDDPSPETSQKLAAGTNRNLVPEASTRINNRFGDRPHGNGHWRARAKPRAEVVPHSPFAHRAPRACVLLAVDGGLTDVVRGLSPCSAPAPQWASLSWPTSCFAALMEAGNCQPV